MAETDQGQPALTARTVSPTRTTPSRTTSAIAPGLCELMKHGRQGVMAEVVRDGVVRVGDAVRAVSAG